MSDELEVALDLDGQTVTVGVAYVLTRRKVTTTDFTYDTDYLANPAAYAIDPALPLETDPPLRAGVRGSA